MISTNSKDLLAMPISDFIISSEKLRMYKVEIVRNMHSLY